MNNQEHLQDYINQEGTQRSLNNDQISTQTNEPVIYRKQQHTQSNLEKGRNLIYIQGILDVYGCDVDIYEEEFKDDYRVIIENQYY